MKTIQPIKVALIDVLLIPIIFSAVALVLWLGDMNIQVFMYVNTLSFLANETVWANITILGDTLVLVSLFALLIKPKPQWALAGLIAAVICAVAVQLMKYGFDVDRPIAILERTKIFLVGDPPSARSFPSGHTASIFVFAGVIFFALNNKTVPILMLLLATLVGMSRVMVAAHWPIDLLIGAAIGWLSAYLGIGISNRFKKITYFFWLMMALLIAISSVLLFFHKTGYEQAQILQWGLALVMSTLSLYNLYWLFCYRRAKP